MTSRALLSLCLLAVLPMALSGCYTRLTTPKEAREFRATYPELDQGLPVDLQNARDNLGNTFVMTADVYLDGLRRFNRATFGQVGYGRDPFRFRAGSEIEVKLIGHKENDVDGIYTVTPEGTIDIGQVSDFPVAGRTRSAIRADLAQRLARFYKGSPDPDAPPTVSVNIPRRSDRLLGEDAVLGSASVMSLGGGGVFGGAGETGSSGSNSSSSGGGSVRLRGDDTLLSVLAESGLYRSSLDWNEVVLFRRVITNRIHQESGRPFEYYMVIVCDLERTIYEDPNLNLEIRDGDMLFMHAEKAPLIVELFRTARVISEVYDAFLGLEFVVEDLFKRDF